MVKLNRKFKWNNKAMTGIGMISKACKDKLKNVPEDEAYVKAVMHGLYRIIHQDGDISFDEFYEDWKERAEETPEN